MITVDAKDGFTAPAIEGARSLLVSKAQSQGVACLAVHRGRHFHAAWWEAEALAMEGLVSLVFVNSAAFVAHTPGGIRKQYGTNPMAFSCPRGAGKLPLVFDQASSAMARGEIQLLEAASQSLPKGVALGPDGVETTDPARGLMGAQLPFGGHKGSNIAMMIELLAAGVSNSPFASEAAVQLESHLGALPSGGMPTTNGELIIALYPSRFGLGNTFGQQVEAFLTSISDSDSAAASTIRLPGERRHSNRAAAISNGGIIMVDQIRLNEALELAGMA